MTQTAQSSSTSTKATRPRPLADALSIALDRGSALGKAPVLAFVGAGGKTSAIFALARELGEFAVLVTTTTKIRDPRLEAGRPVERVEILAGLGEGLAGRPSLDDLAQLPSAHRGGGALVLASALQAEGGKLLGIHGCWIEALRGRCDLLLVEADGARGLPIKAPASWEPVLPPRPDLIVGVMGLDCLGAALGPGTAFRHEILGPLVGCREGEALTSGQLCRLAASPEGLFKGAEPGTRRALILNKAESLPPALLAALVEELAAQLPAGSAVLACSLHDGAGAEILAQGRSGS